MNSPVSEFICVTSVDLFAHYCFLLNHALHVDLEWWLKELCGVRKRKIIKYVPECTLTTDTSEVGFGAELTTMVRCTRHQAIGIIGRPSNQATFEN